MKRGSWLPFKCHVCWFSVLKEHCLFFFVFSFTHTWVAYIVVITPWGAVAEVMVVTGVNSVSSPRPAKVPFLYESHSPSVDIKDNRVTRGADAESSAAYASSVAVETTMSQHVDLQLIFHLETCKHWSFLHLSSRWENLYLLNHSPRVSPQLCRFSRD